MKIYIAGKISGKPFYREYFETAARRLEDQGHTVLNPASLPEGMKQRDYMRICLAMIDAADAVCLISDWEESAGARIEFEYAKYIGKPVMFEDFEDDGENEEEEARGEPLRG